MKLVLVVVVSLLAVTHAFQRNTGPQITVHPPTGPITGYVGELANVYRGIPYATPPVGSLRWRNPTLHAPWTSPFSALEDAPGCPQDCELPKLTCPPTMSEDCLMLNVFTPKNATPDSQLPVMLFIHGGNFKQGYAGGLLYDGSWIASHHNVVMVVIQYRLGALGFLHTDDGISGNFGILDQQVSFKWVKNNIAAFGGNPELLTIFGQSAGAMSVAVHMVMESSQGLFQHAIMESEPFGLPFRTPKTWVPAVSALAKYAGCSSASNTSACLMEASTADVVGAQVRVEKDIAADLQNLLQLFLPWTPTAGSPLLTAQPMELFQQRKSMDIPFMIGTVWNEATIFVYEAFTKPMKETEYAVVLGLIFGIEDGVKIAEHFPVPKNETDDCRLTAAKVATQGLFVCSTRNVSLIVSGGQSHPVHVYHYDHLMSFRKLIWGSNFTICDTEVCHGAELVPLFHPNVSSFNVTYTPQEQVLSSSMDTFWTNVAKTGSPGSYGGLAFEAFNPSTQYTMLLETPTDKLMSKEFADECEFWTQLDWWSRNYK